MRIATVDGLVNLYYDGSKELYNEELRDELSQAYDRIRRLDGLDAAKGIAFEDLEVSVECKNYCIERMTWQQVIVVEGVTEIPEIGGFAFVGNSNLIIVNVPQDTEQSYGAYDSTKLLEISPFQGYYDRSLELNEVHTWLNNINNDEKFALHRVCMRIRMLS